MQKKILFIGFVLMMASTLQLKAQYAKTDSTYKKWFVGSTLFLLGNLSTTNPPNFVQLNIGYRITRKDVITLEPKTWKYAWPNGIHPFLNKSYGKQEEKFPGYVREYGLSVAYQRFLWKGLYAELNVMPTWQTFVNMRAKRLTMDFRFSILTVLVTTSNFLRTDFLFNHPLQLPTVLITQQCLMVLNSWMINGRNLSSENRDFILGLIFNNISVD